VETFLPVSSRLWIPAVDRDEVDELSNRYGCPVHHSYDIQADAYMWERRGRIPADRRGEVVFSILQSNREILLHTKHSYSPPIFRLLSGGIEFGESVESALLREVREETSQQVEVESFVGLLVYHFHHRGQVASFASYVFHLCSQGGEPRDDLCKEVAAYRTVPSKQLRQIAAGLRSLNGERQCWGIWRAIAHDVVHDALCQRQARRL
jgi:ADP-ribose pyrophosphatase YjhB (NUDIX family)